MPHTHLCPEPVVHVVGLLATYRARWLIPAGVVALGACLYAGIRPETWEASQALIIRNEAVASEQGPGKFDRPDERKTVLETILELVQSRGVLHAALVQVGPPPRAQGNPANWPRAKDVEALRRAVKLSPPKGAEFGTTEVSYLLVRDADRGRAIALATAICDQLEARFQQLRDAKAQSMIDELVRAVNLARQDLADCTARLSAMERATGSDLAELRLLHDASSGESSLRRTATEIRQELRQVDSAQRTAEELLAVLQAAQENPDCLVATPNELLQSQPALKRLKEGLIDAQLKTAQLLGSMSQDHPLLRAAKEAENEIRRHLHDELHSAIQSLQVELRLGADRKSLLDERLAAANRRLDQLAAVRAEYSSLIDQTRHRTQILQRAEQKLADARIAQATAKASSLIARIDTPDPGVRPRGPGRVTIALCGALGGLVVGVGLVVLTVPTVPTDTTRARGDAAIVGLRTTPPGNGSRPRCPPASSRILSLRHCFGRIRQPPE